SVYARLLSDTQVWRILIRMRYLLPLLLAGCLGLVACASGPLYRPAPEPGDYGYRDMALTEHRFRVSFAGGYGVAQEVVQNLALYRAAEVALIHGADTFQLVTRDTQAVTDYSGPTTRFGYGFGYPFWSLGIGMSHMRSEVRYETVLEIRIGPTVPKQGPDIYN